MVARMPKGSQPSGSAAPQRLRAYYAWDAPTRWFHWINAILVLGLLVLGIALLTGRWFGVGEEGRHLLLRIHMTLGAALVLNLAWRGYWAFRGGRTAQWRATLPGGPGYWRDLKAYLSAFIAGHPKYYVGHNPLARIGVAVLFILLAAQILSGLMLFGIDQLAPPAPLWPAEPSPQLSRGALPPSLPWLIDWTAADAEAVRHPVRLAHLYGFYLLVIAVLQHVAAVVTTELREGGDLVSAMLTGWKSLPGSPSDEERTDIKPHRKRHGRRR